MGLASKLAAAQGGAGAGGGGGGYGAPPGAPPQQQQYGAPQQQQQGSYGQAPPAPGGRPASGQYAPPSGAPPPQGQGQYGQPPQGQYGQPPQGQYGQQSQGQYGQQSGQYGQPPQQYGGQQQQYGQQQGGQGQYGQMPQAQPYGQQPQSQSSQYGGYAPPSGAPPGGLPSQQYGQQPPQYRPQPGAPVGGAQGGQGGGQTSNPGFLLSTLQQCVTDQNLQAFYPQGSLDMIAAKVASSGALEKIANEWKIPLELAGDLVKLSLFDTVLLLDDSGSMKFEEGGERIDDLKLILSRVAYATSLFDQDGIQVRFLNSRVEGNNIATEQAALALVQQVQFSGLTPLGTSLEQKILAPMVLGPARANRLQKPVLVICITDGTPAGESKDHVFNVIIRADQELKRTRYGPDSISYQFAQVGNDMKATKFLGELDNHPQVGPLIDCTSSFEIEQEEMKRKSGIDLDPSMWIVKLLMGAIDTSYDSKDE